MRLGVLIVLAILAFGNFFWCRYGLIYVPSIDGIVLTLTADRSDADIEKQLAWHDDLARMVFADAGAVGPLVRVNAPDGIAYTFPPDAKAADVERTLRELYPAEMAHTLANGLPAVDTLPEDRAYLEMIASGFSVTEAAQVRDLSIDRAYRKGFAEQMEKLEVEHQQRLASRKPLSTLTAKERIAEARRDRRWVPCNLLAACGLLR